MVASAAGPVGTARPPQTAGQGRAAADRISADRPPPHAPRRAADATVPLPGYAGKAGSTSRRLGCFTSSAASLRTCREPFQPTCGLMK